MDAAVEQLRACIARYDSSTSLEYNRLLDSAVQNLLQQANTNNDGIVHYNHKFLHKILKRRLRSCLQALVRVAPMAVLQTVVCRLVIEQIMLSKRIDSDDLQFVETLFDTNATVVMNNILETIKQVLTMPGTDENEALLHQSLHLIDHCYQLYHAKNIHNNFAMSIRCMTTVFHVLACIDQQQASDRVATNNGPLGPSLQQTTSTINAVVLNNLRVQCLELLFKLEQKHTNNKSTSNSVVFKALEFIAQRPQSPSVRLYIVMLTFCRNDTDYLLSLLQQQQQQQSTFVYQRFYTELLAELSYFDNGDCLWRHCLPLFESLQNNNSLQNSNSNNLLHSIAHLLTRRGTMLCQRAEFMSLAAQWSVEYPSIELWIPSTLPRDEQKRLLRPLKTAGIFGVLTKTTTSAKSNSISNIGLWTGDNNIRRVFSKLPTGTLKSGLFSMQSLRNKGAAEVRHVKPVERCTTSVITEMAFTKGDVPVDQYLNDNILYHIFTFLNYKRLVKMRYVCKYWKSVAECDPLWFDLYTKKFKLRPDDPNAQLVINNNDKWYKLFANRRRAEQSLRPSITAFRPCLCTFVGCTEIMNTQKRYDAHYKKHNNEITRRKRQLEKEEAAVLKKRARPSSSTMKRKKITNPPKDGKCRDKMLDGICQKPPMEAGIDNSDDQGVADNVSEAQLIQVMDI